MISPKRKHELAEQIFQKYDSMYIEFRYEETLEIIKESFDVYHREVLRHLKGGTTMTQALAYPSETPKQKPSIGRVVHYQKYGTPGGEHKSEPSAAIITKVINEETMECQLFVMNPNGVYFNATPYSDEPKPGHWNWPPRV